MKLSTIVLTVALGLSAGLVGAAQADPANPPSQANPPAQQVATVPSTETEYQSLDAFRANINPTMVPTTGQYDPEDQFVNHEGFPLGGYKEIGNPPQ